jgi:hypothetical protein
MANKLADISPAVIRELEEARGIAATKGHCAGNGGLRGHSVGGVFPCVIYSYGNPNNGLLWGFISPDSVEHEDYASYDAAYSAAEAWLKERAQ